MAEGPGSWSGRGSGSCPSEWGRLRPVHSAVRWGWGQLLPPTVLEGGLSLTTSQCQVEPAH